MRSYCEKIIERGIKAPAFKQLIPYWKTKYKLHIGDSSSQLKDIMLARAH